MSLIARMGISWNVVAATVHVMKQDSGLAQMLFAKVGGHCRYPESDLCVHLDDPLCININYPNLWVLTSVYIYLYI